MDVFRAVSNIYDEAFCESTRQLKTGNLFRKKLISSWMFDRFLSKPLKKILAFSEKVFCFT